MQWFHAVRNKNKKYTFYKMLKIKTKKLSENAMMPQQMNVGDAGFDLVATSRCIDKKHNAVVYGTGLSFELPDGYAMFIFPRSSSYKHHALMANCVGVVDSGYRGEVHVMFRGLDCDYEVGDRIAQAVIMPIPSVEYVEAEELSDSERGANGIGSTGVR